jgi:hypothetical protein
MRRNVPAVPARGMEIFVYLFRSVERGKVDSPPSGARGKQRIGFTSQDVKNILTCTFFTAKIGRRIIMNKQQRREKCF